MKKIILSAFIAFGIASCSNDESSSEKESGIQTGTVQVAFGNSFLQPSKSTRKDVIRDGSIPTPIDDIKISRKFLEAGGSASFPDNSTDFHFVSSGTPGATSD